jgi:DNA-binding HxlR family transcriptional regulator
MRFGELRRSLPGITEKMLAQQLDEMEHNQLIIRTQYPEMPPRVEYSLSPFGQSLGPILELLKTWGMEHRAQIVELLEARVSEPALEPY